MKARHRQRAAAIAHRMLALVDEAPPVYQGEIVTRAWLWELIDDTERVPEEDLVELFEALGYSEARAEEFAETGVAMLTALKRQLAS